MRIIPVMDILERTVVHAVGGEREKYEPVDSVLANTADPLPIALRFEEFGFEELYLADLDAIQGEEENFEVIEELASKTSLDLIVDAGFESADDILPYLEGGMDKPVLATETLRSFDEVGKAVEEYSLSVVGSIDVKGGEIMANYLQNITPLEAVREYEVKGVSEVILLNLERVGGSSGPDGNLLSRVLEVSEVPVLIGGGVRGPDDLRLLERKGAAGALVATALHSGSIGSDYLEEL